ncbi:MAG: phosphoglycerate transporter [Chloroflexi bacterium]|nr:MAG: phosphoglycerate transporter [Chloroflexota bacterium]
MTLDIGWFSTGRGPGSRRLLAAVQDEIASGRLDARIAVVFCNRNPGEDENTDLFLEQVRGSGAPLVSLSSREFRRRRGEKPVLKGELLPEWRSEYDREAMRLLEPYPFDIGVLAGYMLIFTELFLSQYDLLNLHPAAPGGPKGIWQDVIWQLIETRAQRAGVMMHLATPELDEGPPVTFCSYALRGPSFDSLWRDVEARTVEDIKAAEAEANALFAEIRHQGVAREVPLVIETLRALADRRICIAEKQPTDAAGNPIPPADLTREIERVVAETPA